MNTILVAVNLDNVIGRQGIIPWDCPEDRKFFKSMTLNSTVLMGSKTYFSIPEKFRPLKSRRNVVCTRSKIIPEVEICRNLDLFFSQNSNITIIGGEEIYNQTFKYTKAILLCRIPNRESGDRFFNVPQEFKLEEEIKFDSFVLEKYKRN